MNDTKIGPADGDLPIERVERIGDYFKSLFVRSLKLDLESGVRESPWEGLPELARRPGTSSIEADSSRPAASAGDDGESREKEAV